jgi:hypothetical protein
VQPRHQTSASATHSFGNPCGGSDMRYEDREQGRGSEQDLRHEKRRQQRWMEL